MDNHRQKMEICWNNPAEIIHEPLMLHQQNQQLSKQIPPEQMMQQCCSQNQLILWEMMHFDMSLLRMYFFF